MEEEKVEGVEQEFQQGVKYSVTKVGITKKNKSKTNLAIKSEKKARRKNRSKMKVRHHMTSKEKKARK